MNKTTPLGIVSSAILAALILAYVPFLNMLGYPLRLLITIVHELGHGLTAMLTGGSFLRFVIFPNGEGLAYTAGGWRLLVIPAGYLSSALFGAALILLGRSPRWSRSALAVTGGLLLICSLRYGIPSLFSTQWLSAVITVVVGVVFGLLFIAVARRATQAWTLFLTNLLAIQAGLMAWSDLLALISLSSGSYGQVRTDAQSMAELTFIPAIIWALIWAVMAALVIGWATWRAWLSPSQR